ncbi:MAG TPA: hypothetical protein DEQ03_12030 [Marinilabiliales bacterium]|nr:hypothetical protein [Marinilabiliales bacterium]
MKIGLKFWSINEDYITEALKLYAESYFHYIELYVVPRSYQKHIYLWKSIREKHNVPFIIHAPHFAHAFNLANSKCFNSNVNIYREVKRFADTLTVEFIIFHGGVDGNIKETVRQLKNLDEPRALIENKPYKALPNNMGADICRGYSIEEIQYVLEQVKCGFCLDIGHAICSANSQKKEIYTYVDEFIKLKPLMFHLTDCDDINSEFDSHVHLGLGNLDMARIANKIPDDAMMTIETNKNADMTLDDFREDVNSIRCLR